MKIAAEMDVSVNPTLTFFNTQHEDEGLKVPGSYSYDVYEEILFEMLGDEPKPSETPPLECFIEYFRFVASKEIALVYDLSLEEVEKEMKNWRLLKRLPKWKPNTECFGSLSALILMNINHVKNSRRRAYA